MEINTLIVEREKARENKDFPKSDMIRCYHLVFIGWLEQRKKLNRFVEACFAGAK